MDLNEVIKKRRSNRAFKNKKISREIIISLIENARLAPSAANRQPWYFVVLEDKRHEIAQIMTEEFQKESNRQNMMKNNTKNYKPLASVKGSIQVINEAPILILVFWSPNPIWKEGDYLSIGCAVEHICLSATNLGLGSLWLRDVTFCKDRITKHLGLDNLELVTGIAIGYAKTELWRAKKKDIKDILKFYD